MFQRFKALGQRWRAAKRVNRGYSPVLASEMDLSSYLKQFIKKSAASLALADGELGLKFLRKQNDGEGLCLRDARYHLVLSYIATGRYPVTLANIGFNLGRLGSGVRIKQIQAKRHDTLKNMYGYGDEYHRERMVAIMRSLRWEKMLVQMVSDWAVKNGFRKIKMLKAKHNRWRKRTISMEASQFNERLKMHYDVTAERMGFKEAFLSRYWTKNLA